MNPLEQAVWAAAYVSRVGAHHPEHGSAAAYADAVVAQLRVTVAALKGSPSGALSDESRASLERGLADIRAGRVTPLDMSQLAPAETDFQRVAQINLQRCERWHDINDWSPADWAVAMAGEAGEVCNAIKKLKRIKDGIANISRDPSRQLNTEKEAIAKIGEELADTFLYLDLLAQRLGIDLEAEIVVKFNKVSEEYGFPERL